jgi:hypothetical protein
MVVQVVQVVHQALKTVALAVLDKLLLNIGHKEIK